MSDIEALIAQVGDGSGLILDPALDSFYLMDAVVVEFPSAQDSLGQIRALVLDIAQRGAQGDDRVNLKVLSGAVQGRVDTIKRGMNVAYGNTQDARLKSAIDPLLQRFTVDTERFLAAVDSSSSDPRAVAEAASTAIDAQFAFQAAMSDSLDGLLSARRDDYAGKAQRVELVAGSALVVVLYLFMGFYRGVKRSVDEIGAVARQLADHDIPILVNSMRALATGDLTSEARLSAQPLQITSRDELGRIGSDFNRLIGGVQETGTAYDGMRASLRDLVADVNAAAQSTAANAAELEQVCGQTGAAAGVLLAGVAGAATAFEATRRDAYATSEAVRQLNGAIDSIALGATDQAGQAQAALGSAGTLASGVQDVAIRAHGVAEASQQTRAAADEGTRAVEETTAAMLSIRTVVDAATAKVQELGRLGESIGAVVETIDGIAEQTNLLALNAAIEAARAGAQGKGFAVVADEVRKLAELSGRETKHIADLIRQVQDATRDAVSATQHGRQQVGVGTGNAEQAGAALEQIRRAVEASVIQVSEIASSAQQMAVGARAMTDSMQSISAVVEQNTAATEQMAAQASEVDGAIQGIASLSQRQSVVIEHLSSSAEAMQSQVDEMAADARKVAGTAELLRGLMARFTLEARTEPVLLRRAA